VAKKFTNGNDHVVLAGKKGQQVDALGGNDTVVGALGPDTINGGEGNDVLAGGEGDDRILGDAGDDTATGGSGANALQGGNGVDALDYSWYGTSQPIYVNLAAGYAVDQVGLNGQPPAPGSGQTFSDAITGFENVIGAPGTANWLVGDLNANLLVGGALADRLEGGGGHDSLGGGAGDDSIRGGTGADTLGGDAGADSFYFRGGDGPDFTGSEPPDDHSTWMNLVAAGLADYVPAFEATDKIIIEFADPAGVSALQVYDPTLNLTFVIYSTDGGDNNSVIIVGGQSIGHLLFSPID
jgi:Ca2+-binding RTX toxin-like protein